MPGARSRHARPPRRLAVVPARATRPASSRTRRPALPTASGRSDSASTDGSTSITPPSDTVRSTSVTSPKSRSIAMLENVSTPNPAIAVIPDASTAEPVNR